MEVYQVRANQVLSIIYLNIELEFKRLIEGYNDPVSAWERLKISHCPDSHSDHMKMFSELIECKSGINESISLFSTRVLQIYNKIKNIDTDFAED